ncbi:MAG: hypothetical protein CVV25_11815 [Ignavibacteriae bacterium HGW-Ignavibacteriae-4]|jgi:hypothetical protein|nr:MAG: hypothetical protein CVV25_11815 [Ignavibacteriae bacterium HGW-Ignavibacteriae-4]
MSYRIFKYVVVLTAIISISFSTYRSVNAQIPGTIDECFKDIECNDNNVAWEKAEWRNETKSVCRIITKYQRSGQAQDSVIGSGVLLNNPNEDNTLYILTAYHTMKISGIEIKDAVANSAFYFNYYNTSCGENSTRTKPIVLNESGGKATPVASLAGSPSNPIGSDYILIKLDIKYDPCNESNIDNLNELYFAGFDKNPNVFYTFDQKIIDYGEGAPKGDKFQRPGPNYRVTGLSHPAGNGYDYKSPYDFIGKGAPMKVHTYEGQILDWKNYTVPERFPEFWKLSMTEGPIDQTPLEYGAVAAGSSGSPLFYENNSNKYVTGQLNNSSPLDRCGVTGERYQLYYGKFSRSWLGDGSAKSSMKEVMDSSGNWSQNNERLEGKKFDGGPIDSYAHRKYVSDDYAMSISQVKYNYDCCWEISINFPEQAACFGYITVEEGSNGVQIEQTEVVGTNPVKFRFSPDANQTTLDVRLYSKHGILLAETKFTTTHCNSVSEYDCACLDAITVTPNSKLEEDCCFTLGGIGTGPNCIFYGFQILDGSKIIYQNHGSSSPILNGAEFCIASEKLGSTTYRLQLLDEYDGSGMAAEVLCEKDIALPECEECTCETILTNPELINLNYSTQCITNTDKEVCFEFFADNSDKEKFLCDVYGIEIKAGETILFSELESASKLNFEVRNFCADLDLFKKANASSLNVTYYKVDGSEICSFDQIFEIDCKMDLRYTVVSETENPCCKTIRFDNLCQLPGTYVVISTDGLAKDTITLEAGRDWATKDIVICDNSNLDKEYKVSLKSTEGITICETSIIPCVEVDCCDGFEVKSIFDPNPPKCDTGCPILIDIKFRDHEACLGHNVDLTYDDNTISYNGSPINFCILSPSGTISAVTTSLPSWMPPCSDEIKIFCDDETGVDAVSLSDFVEYAYVFPNPSSEDITIHFSLKNIGNVNFEIIDMSGKVIVSRSLGLVNKGELTKTIDITSIPVGNYILRFNYEDLSVPFPISIFR